MLKLILFSALFAVVSSEKLRYDNFCLYKVLPDSNEHVKYLNSLYEESDGLEFWIAPRDAGDYVSVVATPERRDEFERSLQKRSINYKVMLQNIQEALDNQVVGRRKRDVSNEMFWTNYQTMEDIYNWLQYLATNHSNLVSLIHAGTSYEGRNITGVKISRGSGDKKFFIEGGQVAADWLSPTVITYLIDQLVKGVDPEARAVTEEFEWHIFPITNPDGHEYSQDAITVGRRAMGSLAVKYNTQYTVGNSRQVFDGATGAIADWAKYRFNPPVVATYALRDEGSWGYTLPVDQVKPTCEETYDSILAIYLFLVTFACASAKFRFDNYTLYKILPENERHISLLRGLQEDARFDFWTDPSPLLNFVSVLSSPGYKHELENFLNENDIQFTISLPDVQDAISKEKIGSYVRSEPNSMRWDTYYKNEDINNWLDSLAIAYPNIVTVVVGGRTFEGREIKGVKISHGSGRRAIFIESGIHAREWIAPATTNYIINELLTSNNADTMAAARDYDWYIFPVTNPDGYIWSHEQFRMWRKNRRPITADAVGVDLNRNWNSNWLVHGSSLDPSTDNYAGPGPFSEPESRSLSEYIRGINNIELYLSMHSFNLATGGSIDWVKSHLNVPLVYCYELRDRGEYGFLLPPEQILDNSQEVMDSLLEIIHQAKRFGYMDSGSDILRVSVLSILSFCIVYLLKIKLHIEEIFS
ncbi:unnamed protein product, partial [Leptidea sinapis]